MKEGLRSDVEWWMRFHHLTKERRPPMLYAGIDYHKRYSQVQVIDHDGRTRVTARLANDGRTVGEFFKSLEEPCAAVLEAGWNWGVMYDWLPSRISRRLSWLSPSEGGRLPQPRSRPTPSTRIPWLSCCVRI